MKKRNGFTLIELLAVIIILAVIALIATPIVLNVVDKAKESSRQSSVAGYADATRLAVIDSVFGGTTPKVDKDWAEANVKKQGQDIICEEVLYSDIYGVVLHNCEVDGVKPYYFASGKVYKDGNDATYKAIYDSIKGGSITPTIPVSGVSDNCAKAGSTCTIDQIKTGVFMNVQVNNTDTHKFYVLSDDGTNVTLLMDRNLDLDGNGTPNDNVAWYIIGNGDNTSGPTTALTTLENKTNTWTNLPNTTYSLIGTSANDYNGCDPYNTCLINTYSISERTNVKARLPRNQELLAIGCTGSSNSCPAWAYDYLNGRPNPVSETFGYWTSTAAAPNSYNVWSVDNNGEFSNRSAGHEYINGVRPVITISKSNIK